MDLCLLKEVFDLDPTTVRARNRKSWLPAHTALTGGEQWGRGAELLLKSYEAAAKEPGDEEIQVLLFACACSCDFAMEAFLEKYPEAQHSTEGQEGRQSIAYLFKSLSQCS